MYGTDEPWWFFEGWKEDIVSVNEFDDFYKALKFYKQEWYKLAHLFKDYTSTAGLQTAFWKEDEQEWCEECVDYLQCYHSVALLEDWHEIPLERLRAGYKKNSKEHPIRFCSLENNF
jgi:hypothetical protein